MKKLIRTLAAAATVCAGVSVSGGNAFALDLPPENCGSTTISNTDTCLYFGDFAVYSLPLLDYYQKTPSTALSGSLQGLDLTVSISEIDLWVSNNNGQSNGPQGAGTGIDDPYDAAQGDAQGIDDNLIFLMTSDALGGQFEVPTDPPGGPTPGDNVLQSSTTVLSTSTYINSDTAVGDPADYNDGCYANLNGCLPLWDADLDDLRTALDGGDLVFLFRNNETGDSGTLAGQDLLAWARVCLSSADGSSSTCFTLGGDENVDDSSTDARYDSQTAAVDDVLPTADDMWAHVHSDLCVLNSGDVLLGACDLFGIGPADGKTVNQSLGQSEATYAITSKALNDLIYSENSGFDVLTVDVRFSWLNNGGDWVGITSVTRPDRQLPVPGTLFLFGLGLSALGLTRRKK